MNSRPSRGVGLRRPPLHELFGLFPHDALVLSVDVRRVVPGLVVAPLGHQLLDALLDQPAGGQCQNV